MDRAPWGLLPVARIHCDSLGYGSRRYLVPFRSWSCDADGARTHASGWDQGRHSPESGTSADDASMETPVSFLWLQPYSKR